MLRDSSHDLSEGESEAAAEIALYWSRDSTPRSESLAAQSTQAATIVVGSALDASRRIFVPPLDLSGVRVSLRSWRGCGRFPLCTQCEKSQQPMGSDRSLQADPFSSFTTVPVLGKYRRQVPSSENLGEKDSDPMSTCQLFVS